MKRKRHTPEQIVRKLRDGGRLLNEGKDLVEVLRLLEVTDSTWHRWRHQYGGMKAPDAKRLKEYVSRVMAMFACPRRSLTTFAGTLAPSAAHA